jgi:hypothetical protein
MNAMQKSVTLACALALAMTFGACGGDGENCATNPNGPSCPPPPPPPPPPLETVVIFGDNGPIPAETVGYIEFHIPSAGTVDATVDWTFASSMVAIALTTSACNDFEAAFFSSCSHIGSPNINRTQKPKTLSGSVTQATAARLWVLNLATVDESVAVHVTLTRPRAASAPVILESFARRWVPAPGAATQAIRALQDRK